MLSGLNAIDVIGRLPWGKVATVLFVAKIDDRDGSRFESHRDVFAIRRKGQAGRRCRSRSHQLCTFVSLGTRPQLERCLVAAAGGDRSICSDGECLSRRCRLPAGQLCSYLACSEFPDPSVARRRRMLRNEEATIG